MKQKRSASDIKEKEAEWQKARRQNPIINRQITEINKKRMQRIQRSHMYQKMEMVRKRKKCQDQLYKVIETNQNRLQKQRACKHSINISKGKQQSETKKHGKNLTQLLNIFNSGIAEGPVYVCTCCEQIWFRHSVFNVNEITLKTNDERTTFNTWRTEYVSKDGKEWICKTCRNSI